MKIEITIQRMPDWGQLGMAAGNAAIGGVMGMAMQGANDRRQIRQQQKLTDMQMQAQNRQTDYNYGKQLEMWKATSYGAQKEQMEKAGLNPALMYGMGGGGGQSNNVATGNVTGGTAPQGGGELGMGIQTAMQLALMKAQKENIEADTRNKNTDANYTGGAKTDNTVASTGNLKASQRVMETENDLKQLDLKVNQTTLWDKIHEIESRAIEQQEKGLQAGVTTEVMQSTINEQIDTIKANAINVGLQGAAIKAGIGLTEEQTRKIGVDIAQKWRELELTAQKQGMEHDDRIKAITEYTANALKVAGIQAVGNLVGDVVKIATRGKGSVTKTTTTGDKGTEFKTTVTENR